MVSFFFIVSRGGGGKTGLDGVWGSAFFRALGGGAGAGFTGAAEGSGAGGFDLISGANDVPRFILPILSPPTELVVVSFGDASRSVGGSILHSEPSVTRSGPVT